MVCTFDESTLFSEVKLNQHDDVLIIPENTKDYIKIGRADINKKIVKRDKKSLL